MPTEADVVMLTAHSGKKTLEYSIPLKGIISNKQTGTLLHRFCLFGAPNK